MTEYERRIQKNEKYKDEFRGCLVGGAIGDALGYPVEFMREKEIISRYGKNGIRGYTLAKNGKALISDDTQMTLFTATSLLLGMTRGMTRGVGGLHYSYAGFAYKTWYKMQTGEKPRDEHGYAYSWLADVPEMGECRAPGNTCLSVIGGDTYGTVDEPINNSKGCGGIMRIAPVGLYVNRPGGRNGNLDFLYETAAGVAALTHGHELGWMPAAMLAHIINLITYSGDPLIDCIREAQGYTKKLYGKRKYFEKLNALVDTAISLTHNDKTDSENIRTLGEGWVAEETLAIAVYCSLKYQDDFSKALCVSVNHDGDSDSTGAITGNILGAFWGYQRIPRKWKENLECRDVILEVADDLCHECQIDEYELFDREWVRKYIENKWHEPDVAAEDG